MTGDKPTDGTGFGVISFPKCPSCGKDMVTDPDKPSGVCVLCEVLRRTPDPEVVPRKALADGPLDPPISRDEIALLKLLRSGLVTSLEFGDYSIRRRGKRK